MNLWRRNESQYILVDGLKMIGVVISLVGEHNEWLLKYNIQFYDMKSRQCHNQNDIKNMLSEKSEYEIIFLIRLLYS